MENSKKIVKSKMFSFKASEQLLQILDDLADKKQMSKGALIEYLIRRESDFLSGFKVDVKKD